MKTLRKLKDLGKFKDSLQVMNIKQKWLKNIYGNSGFLKKEGINLKNGFHSPNIGNKNK